MIYVKESGDGLKKLKSAIDTLKKNRVMVGIPGGSSAGSGGITNAQLAFIHSNGSPKLSIPARPFLEPAIAQAKTQDKIAQCMKSAVMAAIDQGEDAAIAELQNAGMAGAEAAKDYILNGGLAPNAPITIHGGWMKNKASGKVFYVRGKGSSKPLIDTASLQNSITYVIEKK